MREIRSSGLVGGAGSRIPAPTPILRRPSPDRCLLLCSRAPLKSRHHPVTAFRPRASFGLRQPAAALRWAQPAVRGGPRKAAAPPRGGRRATDPPPAAGCGLRKAAAGCRSPKRLRRGEAQKEQQENGGSCAGLPLFAPFCFLRLSLAVLSRPEGSEGAQEFGGLFGQEPFQERIDDRPALGATQRIRRSPLRHSSA